MKRFLIATLLVVTIVGLVIAFNQIQLNPADGPAAYFTQVNESLPETTTKPQAPADFMQEIVDNAIKSTTFVDFAAPHVLNIEAIEQLPDYPTGCEIVSLTMALSYITKTAISTDDLIDRYLEYDEKDFVTGFVGDPREPSGAGCFPPVITKCANSFFRQNSYGYKAMDVTSSTKDDLLFYLDRGIPIIIWNTMDMEEPYPAPFAVQHDSKQYDWYYPEHCVLLKGYNDERNVFIINDPLVGEVERDMDEFYDIYERVGSMAVIIA